MSIALGAKMGRRRRIRIASAGAVAFSPASIAGLAAWLKADAGTSTTTDGAAISQWNDQSGNARHAVQAVGGSQPQYKAAILNGLPVVRFGGAAFLDLPAFVLPSAYTIFAVALSSGGVLPESIFDADFNSAPRMFQFRFNTGVIEHIAFNTALSAFTDSQAAVISAAHLLVGRVDPTTVQTWVDNTSDGSTALTGTANSASAAIRIGGHPVGGQLMTGDIAEILYYDSALSTTDRQSVQTYLKAKWGTP